MRNKLKKHIATFTAVLTILCCSTSVHAYMNNVNAGGGKWSYGVGTIGTSCLDKSLSIIIKRKNIMLMQ